MKRLIGYAAGILTAAFLMMGCETPSSPDKLAPLLPSGSSEIQAPSGVDYYTAKVGDILLEDGTFVSQTDFASQNKKAAGIVVFTGDCDPRNKWIKAPIVISLDQGDGLKWCSKGEFYHTTITNFKYMANSQITAKSDKLRDLLIKKLTGGSTSQLLCDIPAWEYCINYGTNKDFKGFLKEGWCLPTIQELTYIENSLRYKYTTLNPFIENSLGGKKMDGFDDDQVYWSSNTTSDETNGCYHSAVYNFKFASVDNLVRTSTANVRPVFHLVNNKDTVAAPVISEYYNSSASQPSFGIATATEGASIKYRTNEGEWQTIEPGNGGSVTNSDTSKDFTVEAYSVSAAGKSSAIKTKLFPRKVN